MPKALAVVTALATAFLVFLAGALTTYFEVFPYQILRNAFIAADALQQEQNELNLADLYIGSKPFVPADALTPAISWTEPGVVEFDPEQAYSGYTVYTPVRSNFPVRMVDMEGATVWQWKINWDALDQPRLDGLDLDINARLAERRMLGIGQPTVLPNGDMLLIVHTGWFTPFGLVLAKVDKFGEPIWVYTKQVHHELSLGPDGEIYVLGHVTVNSPWPGLETIATPFVDDTIVVLSPAGEEQRTVSLLAAIQNSAYASLLMYANPADHKGDLLHANSLKYLDAEAASHIPGAAAGDLLVSLRNADVLAVINLDTERVVWAARGSWRLQHDAEMLANGNMLVFDNRGDLPNGGTSRVLEFDPQTLAIEWQYPGPDDPPIYTAFLGSQQRLPNGNTLICESSNGRIIEVDPSGAIVWDYRVPEIVEKADGSKLATAIFATRFLPEQLPFLNDRNLSQAAD